MHAAGVGGGDGCAVVDTSPVLRTGSALVWLCSMGPQNQGALCSRHALSRQPVLKAGAEARAPDLSRCVTIFSTAAASVRLRYEVPLALISSDPSWT